jgi:Rne/Rng family ribonuclease
MAKEICISSTPHETRLAILEDDQLAEIYYERENEYTLAGSIYNGRVTRVLPGMQSAFVDVGLERDAFLYVTDFLELEDPEEADEIEKAASTGGAQAPREVRSGGERAGGGEKPEGGEGRGGQRQSGRPDRSSQDRQPRERQGQPQNQERRLVVEAATDIEETVAPAAGPSSPQGEGAEDDGAGAKRWRGRRRRRGGRGAAGGAENQAGGEDSSEELVERAPAPSSDIQASAAPAERPAAQSWASSASASVPAASTSPAPRGSQVPVPFVLPGESLRKYGGTAEEEAPKAAASAPARPASTYKPSTLVEAPLAWDGSGLMPGESISKHRTRKPEAEPAAQSYSELSGTFADAAAPDAIEEQEFFTERGETSHESSAEAPALEVHASSSEETFAAPDAEELADAPMVHHEEVTEDPYSDDPTAPAEPIGEESPDDDESDEDDLDGDEFEETEPAGPDSGPEGDSSASHHVDPAPPTGFRLFGLGGKKKSEEPAVTPAAEPAAKPATVAAVSAYAPGAGLIEEETIEEEEFDAPHHHHSKSDDHDLEDYEEETLPAQMRTGDLGEMLQEAHLDHKIQLNFEDKNVEDESFDEDEDEDEEATADGQAGSSQNGAQGQDSSKQRGGRGRRGGGRDRQAGSQQGGGNRRGGGMTRRTAQTSDLPIISDLLKPGQEILVQIAKEPIAKKGARITSHIALPGRFLVFMPTVSHIGVSRKIASDEERQRLKRILVHERGEAAGGFIVRTAAEGASEEELRADLRFLIHLWDEIKQRSDSSKSPALIYHDLSLIERILRDQVSSNFSSIWVDSQEDYERIVRFLNRFSPTLVRRVKMYNKEVPLFEHFGIQDEISKALRSKVWLKSGGSIVINQTEALVAIDINTGKYVGKSARLEDTIVKTNLDAVPEIVRQIRLRDLGGIIVIDFIDMDERKNRFRVLAALEEALKADRAPTKVLQFNDFGLVAITRKRVKQSLERTLSVPCPTCQATGMVKSPTTVCNEIYTELRKMKKHFEGADVLLRVNPETVKVLKQNNASWLTEFEELVGKNILVKSDATLHPEQFDIQG